jgi:galactokinase
VSGAGAVGARGVWAAPGRVNLIGEHTDYNDGFALPLAVPLLLRCAAAPRTDGLLTAVSAQAPGQSVSVPVAALEPGGLRGWAAYPAGVLWALRAAGHRTAGIDLAVDGEVPAGAGLASSHALQCAVALACVDIFGLGLDRVELARIVQRAENEFAGAPTGIMDQLAALCGRAGHALLLDARTLQIEPVPLDLAGHGLALLVIDTRAPHTLVGGQYAARRRTCEQAAALLGVAALRDVAEADLPAALAALDDAVMRRRVRHVVTENGRVLAVADLLRGGADPRAAGPALVASHVSLRDDYEVSCPELDSAVEAALDAGAHGARMTGAGFGGSAIALVDAPAVPAVTGAVRAAFAARGFTAPATFAVTAAGGAARLE